MLLRVVLFGIILFFNQSLFAQTTDLLISEYGEGSSGNSKYIEIYNGTGASVNLANYRLCRISNGGSWCEATYTFTAGSLADGATLVVANNAGDVPLADEYDAGFCSWNGDDAVSLQKFSGSWNLLDVIGTDGADPGTGWDVAGTTNGTQDHVLTRKAAICSPNTNWAASSGTNATNSEWVVSSYTTGSANAGHTSSCASCTPDAEPTTNSSSISFSNIGCNSIDISWTNGNGSNRIVVASTSPISGTPSDQTNYNANAAFGSGDNIAAGEFVVYNSNGNNFTVTGLNTTTTYYFAVFEYNGVAANCTENYLTASPLTGDEITTTCTNAEITGILVDACGGNEGIDEFFSFTNGTSSMNLNDFSVDFPNGETFCNSGCGARTWVTNPTYVAQLNTDASCPGLFVEANPIPANANVVVFTGSNPSYNFDFTGLCGTGPFYAVFANNTNTGGRFGNHDGDCTEYRTLTVDFGGGYTDDVTYQRCSLSNTDGDYVGFDAPGNATYGNDGCTPTALLPIELIEFNAKQQGGSNLLNWSTSSEINNDYFTIEKSENATLFEVLDFVNGAGNSHVQLNYQLMDHTPYLTTYYRLKQTDFDGQFSYSEIIAIHRNTKSDFYYHHHSLVVNTSGWSNYLVSVYSVQGQLIKQLHMNGDAQISAPLHLKNGIYLMTLQSDDGDLIAKKIVVTE